MPKGGFGIRVFLNRDISQLAKPGSDSALRPSEPSTLEQNCCPVGAVPGNFGNEFGAQP